jgi:hypothetical protein
MKIVESRWFYMLKQVAKFGRVHSNYIVTGRYGYQLFLSLDRLILQLERYFYSRSAQPQDSQLLPLKAIIKGAIFESLTTISETAYVIAEDYPEIANKLDLPIKLGDQEIIDLVATFIENSQEIKPILISYAIDEDFQQQLTEMVLLLHQAIEYSSSLTGNQAKYLHHINDCMQEALIILIKLDIIMENQFHDDLLIKIAWLHARKCHISSRKGLTNL